MYLYEGDTKKRRKYVKRMKRDTRERRKYVKRMVDKSCLTNIFRNLSFICFLRTRNFYELFDQREKVV